MNFSYADVSKMIDHSLLNPTLTTAQLEAGISVAIAYDVASVCIVPWYLRQCAVRLAGSNVQPSTTIGFPHGANTTSIKVKEAEQAIKDGGTELDMVANISAVLSGNWDTVADDIRAVTDVTHAAGQKVKVIFENCFLDDAQKIRLCELCSQINVDWVKTSTGYGTGGATDADLILMRKHTAPHIQVKAAGGVRTLDRLLEVRSIGVSRAGATATKVILDEARERLKLPPIEPLMGAQGAGAY